MERGKKMTNDDIHPVGIHPNWKREMKNSADDTVITGELLHQVDPAPLNLSFRMGKSATMMHRRGTRRRFERFLCPAVDFCFQWLLFV